MVDLEIHHVGVFFGLMRWSDVAMQPKSSGSRWESLQARSHLPEVQAILRREISRGTIRVVPATGGGIRIVPVEHGGESDEDPTAPGPPL